MKTNLLSNKIFPNFLSKSYIHVGSGYPYSIVISIVKNGPSVQLIKTKTQNKKKKNNHKLHINIHTVSIPSPSLDQSSNEIKNTQRWRCKQKTHPDTKHSQTATQFWVANIFTHAFGEVIYIFSGSRFEMDIYVMWVCVVYRWNAIVAVNRRRCRRRLPNNSSPHDFRIGRPATFLQPI